MGGAREASDGPDDAEGRPRRRHRPRQLYCEMEIIRLTFSILIYIYIYIYVRVNANVSGVRGMQCGGAEVLYPPWLRPF